MLEKIKKAIVLGILATLAGIALQCASDEKIRSDGKAVIDGILADLGIKDRGAIDGSVQDLARNDASTRDSAKNVDLALHPESTMTADKGKQQDSFLADHSGKPDTQTLDSKLLDQKKSPDQAKKLDSTSHDSIGPKADAAQDGGTSTTAKRYAIPVTTDSTGNASTCGFTFSSNDIPVVQVWYFLPASYYPPNGRWFLDESMYLISVDIVTGCLYVKHGSGTGNQNIRVAVIL
jgi:hypothetical protein